MSAPALQREFWAALAEGDCVAVRRLLESGADVNAPIGDTGGETPLIRAATGGDLDMVRLLISAGADVNQRWNGSRSWTPLMFAHDQPPVLRELIGAGADVNARTTAHWMGSGKGGRKLPGGETALHLAAAAGNAEAVRVLIQAGADIEAHAEDGRAPLDYAIALGNVTEAAEALVESGAKLTPQRLETMHSSAHRPDSDVIAFPLVDQVGSCPPGDEPNSTPNRRPQPGLPPIRPPADFRCPNCDALLYSRKPKICGQCGALLPQELVVTDQQAYEQAEERRWARELADQFDPHRTSTDRSLAPGISRERSDTTPPETPAAADLLRRVSCAEEFKHRDRPVFWLYVSASIFAVGVLVYLLRLLSGPQPMAVLTLIVILVLHLYFAWHRASPVCPNCHQNIRYCPASFCHVCGQPLKNRRCEGCGVDNSWLRFLRPYSSIANFRWITFCPGCGAHLESRVSRWRAHC